MSFKHTLFVSALILLAAIGTRLSSHVENIEPNVPFATFPKQIREWVGKEERFDDQVSAILGVDDYFLCNYLTPDRRSVQLYVGFYQSQRRGATYHSPKNCLPGAGWQFVKSDYVTLPMPGDQSVTINRVLIQKGLDKQVILYWYHDRGRVISSEYWAKGYLVWDAMTKHRSDGSLVRISVPVQGGTEEDAFDHAVRFLEDLWPVLLDFMPDQTII